MFRAATFWMVFIPSALIVGCAFLLTTQAEALPVSSSALGGLLLLAVAAQSWWMHRRMNQLLSALRDTVGAWDDTQAAPVSADHLPGDFRQLLLPIQLAGGRLLRRVKSVERMAADQTQMTEMLHAVLTTVAEGVIVVDAEEQVLFANETARGLLSISSRHVVGRPIWEVTRSARIHEVVQQVLSTQESQQCDIDMPRGKSVVSLTVTPLPREPIPGAVLLVQDMTTLRQLESTRRDFVTNVSHELKTPLTSIQAYADTLLEDPDGSQDQKEFFLSKIISESERLHQIILDLIRLGRIESQREPFAIQDVSVDSVVNACLEDHRTVAEAKGVRLAADPPSQPVIVSADSHEVRTILDNLVDNAIKYADTNGHVCVRWHAGADMGVIEVDDDGVGIPKDQQSRVFERFYRVDRARDRERGGTGLGLSIVKHLSQVFGGSVEVDSEMGRGSTFRVFLPLSKSAGPISREIHPQSAVSSTP